MKLKVNKLTIGRIAQLIGATVITGAAIAGTCVAAFFAPYITTFLSGTGAGNFESDEYKQAAALSDELCQKVEEEGVVLLKNKNNALPLDTDKVNLFGWRSTDQGFHLSGIGSGASTINENKKVTLLDAFEKEDIQYNQELIDFYNDYDDFEGGYGTGTSNRMPFREPSLNEYSDGLINNAIEFSDVAIVTISRVSGENVGEIPMTQDKIHQNDDSSRHYLELTTEEEDLLKMCRENFSKVIVLLNTSNQMELGFLEDLDIDAALLVGLTGQSGALAIPRILKGDINPSGRTADIFPYDLTNDPTFNNYARSWDNVTYAEDIYYGYKYYETADNIGNFSSVNNEYGEGYNGVIQYPFGYGLSYSEFEWGIEKIDVNGTEYSKDEDIPLTKDSEVTITLRCTNIGSVAGKDVMQLYVSAPYTQGEIEKPSIKLIDFEKTTDINGGLTQSEINLSFNAYDLASYDCYDANDNGSATWELDAGEYEIKFMGNSHFSKAMVEGDPTSLTFVVGNGTTANAQDIIFDKDSVSGHTVENVFTGDTAIAEVPIDGSTVFENGVDYFSRSDNFSKIPENQGSPDVSSEVSKANNYENTGFNQDTMPTLNQNHGHYLNTYSDGSQPSLTDLRNNIRDENNPNRLVYNEELIYTIGENYNSDELNEIVDQLSADEACQIVEDSGFGTPAIESIGKTRSYDFDGPAGFNTNTQTGITSGEWTAYPNQTLIGQTFSKRIAKEIGLSMGAEGRLTGLQGWYAPVVNLHRSPFNGRNYEMYSEDPVLSGLLAAETIDGAKANGVYCYVKHFGPTEPGQNSRNLNTWLTEQNLRENYFKAFEIAIKEGEAVAVMSSFSSIGGVWSGANNGANITILRDEWGFKGSVLTDWSDGGGNMNPHDGVRGGNDIWLNPNVGNNANKLNRSNATDVYCAKMAAKNVIYTYCNTKYYSEVAYDHDQDDVSYPIGEYNITPPFPWWIPLLAALDVVLIGGSLTWAGFTLFYPGKKKPEGTDL